MPDVHGRCEERIDFAPCNILMSSIFAVPLSVENAEEIFCA
jgi:hypothetical protein